MLLLNQFTVNITLSARNINWFSDFPGFKPAPTFFSVRGNTMVKKLPKSKRGPAHYDNTSVHIGLLKGQRLTRPL